MKSRTERLEEARDAAEAYADQAGRQIVNLRAEIERLSVAVQVLRDFPGFIDDAIIGDRWVSRKNAALATIDLARPLTTAAESQGDK